MTLAELIDAFRLDMDDQREPPYWSDELLTRYLNQAESEAARRARLILDSVTEKDAESSPICVYAVDADDRFITLNRRVIEVKRVKLASKTMPIPKAYRADIDQLFPDWENAASSDVVAYCSDYSDGRIYFVTPFPDDDTVTLTVNREPLRAMVEDEDEPEIDLRYHEGLLNWAKFRGLNNMDIKEKYDPAAAKTYLDAFESEFGKKRSAQEEKWVEREQRYDSLDGAY